MSKRTPLLLIEDIIESGQKILDYTTGLTFDEFVTDSKTVDAVVRNFEIIGEAANRLPQDFGIDYSIVWQIKENFLPEMIEKLRAINQ
jgi:uncharacterized protein with HEPN domain